jgi:hypothetical protein
MSQQCPQGAIANLKREFSSWRIKRLRLEIEEALKSELLTN